MNVRSRPTTGDGNGAPSCTLSSAYDPSLKYNDPQPRCEGCGPPRCAGQSSDSSRMVPSYTPNRSRKVALDVDERFGSARDHVRGLDRGPAHGAVPGRPGRDRSRQRHPLTSAASIGGPEVQALRVDELALAPPAPAPEEHGLPGLDLVPARGASLRPVPPSFVKAGCRASVRDGWRVSPSDDPLGSVTHTNRLPRNCVSSLLVATAARLEPSRGQATRGVNHQPRRVNHQPRHRQPSTEPKPSRITRDCTAVRCPRQDSNLRHTV